MKICEICNQPRHPGIMIALTDAAKTIELCPNCLAIMVLENKLVFQNNPSFIDDITGKPGAVKFESYGESYALESETMMRLVAHNLRQHEYLALAKKYGADKFMIHDDFYDIDGTPIQPMV